MPMTEFRGWQFLERFEPWGDRRLDFVVGLALAHMKGGKPIQFMNDWDIPEPQQQFMDDWLAFEQRQQAREEREKLVN